MQRNKALEKYQKKAYKQHIDTYAFRVDISGTTSNEDKRLNSMKSGVNLHFLRYGIFSPRWYYKTDFIDVQAPNDNRPHVPFETSNDPDEINPNDPIELNEVFIYGNRSYPKPSKKAPELKSAQYRLTGIDQGYIYIHEKGNENFWLEFSIDSNGHINPIHWEDNVGKDGKYKDVRDTISEESFPSYIIDECAEIYVTHTLSQLSVQQLEEYSSSPEDYERLQYILCKAIEKSSDPTDRQHEAYKAFGEFGASFTVYKKTNAQLLQSKLNNIAQLEYPENRDEEDNVFEDVFILLEDPVQCANDLVKVIDGEMAWLKALTDTLKNGESAYDVYDDLMKLPIYSDSTVGVCDEKEKEEIRYIFALALATYKFIYDNKELKDDFSRKHGEWYLNHGIDDQKLDKVLAITQRRNQRELINGLRNDMGGLMKSTYYDLALDDFKEGSYLMINDAKDYIADHLGALVVHPTMIDRHLLLASEYNPYEDKWIKQVRKTIRGNSKFRNVDKLLDIRIPIEEVEKDDSEAGKYAAKFCKKFLSHFGKMLKAYSAVGSLKAAEVKIGELKVNYLTSISKSGKVGPFFRVNRKELLATLENQKGGYKKHQQFKASPNNHFTKTYAFLKVHNEIEAESKNIARRTGASKEGQIAAQGTSRLKFSKQLEKMVQSGEYKTAVLAFEVWALIASVNKMYDEGFSWGQTAIIGGALIKTTAATLKLVEHAYEIRGIEKKILSKTAKVFSPLSSGVTVVMATKDAIKTFKASDNDASIAFSVAAGISGYLLAAELGAVSLSTGPFIVLAGIGLAVYGIAYYLTDSDLEKFFKHYPFSTQVPNASNSENPFLYARAMYRKSDKLIGRYEKQYMSSEGVSYKQLFVRITNLLAGGVLTIEGSSSKNANADSFFESKRETNSRNSSTRFWTSLDIRISFSSFLQNKQQVHYEVYLIQRPSFLESKVSYRLPDYCIRPYLIEKENSHKKLQLWYRVSEEINYIQTGIDEGESKKSVAFLSASTKVEKKLHVQSDARIAVLCQMKGNEETIFPLTQSDRHGYLYTEMTVGFQYSDGRLIRRSFDPIIITKQAFLNAYPLQNPEL